MSSIRKPFISINTIIKMVRDVVYQYFIIFIEMIQYRNEKAMKSVYLMNLFFQKAKVSATLSRRNFILFKNEFC